jgi:hypothetical protein
VSRKCPKPSSILDLICNGLCRKLYHKLLANINELFKPLEEYIDEAEEVILHLATGQISWQEFSTWLEAHAQLMLTDL